MAFELNELGGSLWHNENRTNERQPDMTGSVKVDGQEYRVSGWLKETRNGKEFISMALTVKDDTNNSGRQARPSANRGQSLKEKQAEFDRMTKGEPQSNKAGPDYAQPQGGADYLDDDMPF